MAGTGAEAAARAPTDRVTIHRYDNAPFACVPNPREVGDEAVMGFVALAWLGEIPFMRVSNPWGTV
jgi:hypothetical protein